MVSPFARAVSILFALLAALSLGCAPSPSSQGAQGGYDGQSPRQTTVDAAGQSDSYYDFDDIIVPHDMKLDNAESFILETGQAKSGVMVFTGRVEIKSLTDYFINNMAKDNWDLRCAFKSNRTILVFEKPDRYCIVNVTDEHFTTLLEIWVAPRRELAGY